jgi:curved DNA-binding protein CbpA
MTQNTEKIRSLDTEKTGVEPVDFYRLLQISSDADERALQQRIHQYYLEAQQNLDHRNARKRLHFQQMYEIYLPQARRVLLDPQRRAEYDRFLQAQEKNTPASTHNIRHDVVTQATTPQSAAAGDVAGQRLAQWQQWQQDLAAALAESEARIASEAKTQSAGSAGENPTQFSSHEPKRPEPKRSWNMENVAAPAPVAAPKPIPVAEPSRFKTEYFFVAGALLIFVLGVTIFRSAATKGSAGSGVSQPFKGAPFIVPGTIQAEDYDLGGEGVAYSDSSTQNQGGGYREGAVGIGAIAGGNYYVGWTQSGEWIQYTVNAAQSGKYRLDLRLRTRGPGRIAVQLDGEEVVSGFLVPDTANMWQTMMIGELNMPQGRHSVRLVLYDANTNLDFFQLSIMP